MLVREHIESYWVTGSSWSQITDAIALLGPWRGRRRYAAFTDWSVSWVWSPSSSASSVDLAITVTLPRWLPTSIASRSLRAGWDDYLCGLRDHERGHRDLALRAGSAVESALGAAVGQSESFVRRTVEDILARHREDERRYDLETRHGAIDPRMSAHRFGERAS